MKKQLICIAAAAAAMMLAGITSYAATYDTQEQSVNVSEASTKKTVLITKGTDSPSESNIVYMNQADNTFNTAVDFKLKENPTEGVYTIRLGGGTDTNAESTTFYIGVESAAYAGDVKMTQVDKKEGDPAKSYGYKATVTASTSYKSVIIKTDTGYLGISIPEMKLENVEGNAVMGIQINGVDDVNKIQGVWLSTRTITENADGNTSTASK